MKLNFMTWVMISTPYTIYDVDRDFFAIEEIRNPKNNMCSVWFSKEDGLMLDHPAEGYFSAQQVIEMSKVPDHWLPIKKMFLEYKAGGK